jgi:hypothetical protein
MFNLESMCRGGSVGASVSFVGSQRKTTRGRKTAPADRNEQEEKPSRHSQEDTGKGNRQSLSKKESSSKAITSWKTSDDDSELDFIT